MYFNSRSIVIKNIDYKESDKLVTVFSERKGKIQAIARGIKKPGSSLRASVQPFCHSLLFFHSGKDLALITQGRLINFYGNSREDINRTLYCVYIMELLEKSLMDHVPMPKLFNLTLAVLNDINIHGLNPLVLRYLEMQLMVELGFRPEFNHCAQCGQKGNIFKIFSPEMGGMLCPSCENQKGGILLTGEVLGLLKLMLNGSITALQRVRASAAALTKVESFLELYMEYHLERRFNLKNTIRVIKKSLS